MFNIKKKTCLESKRGQHEFPDKWSKPMKVSFQKEFGSFGNTSTEYKYIQTKTCKLCGLIYTSVMCYGSIQNDVFLEKEE
jgi:hypothetical protein